MIYVDWNNIFQ